MTSIGGEGSDQLEQLPLTFVKWELQQAQSGRRVIESIIIAALFRRSGVQAVVADFEAAVWVAGQKVLPGVIRNAAAVSISIQCRPHGGAFRVWEFRPSVRATPT